MHRIEPVNHLGSSVMWADEQSLVAHLWWKTLTETSSTREASLNASRRPSCRPRRRFARVSLTARRSPFRYPDPDQMEVTLHRDRLNPREIRVAFTLDVREDGYGPPSELCFLPQKTRPLTYPGYVPFVAETFACIIELPVVAGLGLVAVLWSESADPEGLYADLGCSGQFRKSSESPMPSGPRSYAVRSFSWSCWRAPGRQRLWR